MSMMCQKCSLLEREIIALKADNLSLKDEIKSVLKSKAALLESCEEAQDCVSNKLFREIRLLKEEKLNLCTAVEEERQQLLDAVERRLKKLRQEKVELEAILEAEQECIVNKLLSSSPTIIPKRSFFGSRGSGSSSASNTSVNNDPTSDLRNALSETEDQNNVLIIENVKLQQKLRRQSLENDVYHHHQHQLQGPLQRQNNYQETNSQQENLSTSMPAPFFYKPNK